MTADFKLDENYKIKHNKQLTTSSNTFPEIVYEYLDESFAVNTVDWTPKETHTHTMVGQPTCSKALEVLAYITNEAENPPPFLLRDQLSIKQARQVLEKRYSEPWTIKRLSREVGINECKLKQGFRELLKTSVHSCLVDIRISQACQLLASSTESVTAIGLQTGYSNPSHFARVFSQKIGKTPRQWRQNKLTN